MTELRANLACLLCSRPAAELRGDRLQVVRVLDPAHVACVRRRVCPTCGGRLHITEIEEVWVVSRRPLTADEITPKPKRPRGLPKGRWSLLYDACVACGRTDSRHNSHGRCGRCKSRVAREARSA